MYLALNKLRDFTSNYLLYTCIFTVNLSSLVGRTHVCTSLIILRHFSILIHIFTIHWLLVIWNQVPKPSDRLHMGVSMTSLHKVISFTLLLCVESLLSLLIDICLLGLLRLLTNLLRKSRGLLDLLVLSAFGLDTGVLWFPVPTLRSSLSNILSNTLDFHPLHWMKRVITHFLPSSIVLVSIPLLFFNF